MFVKLYPDRQHPQELRGKIGELIRTMNVLRAAQAKYRFMDEFLYHIMRNKMKKGAVQTKFLVKTPLVALTANEAGRIARSFVMILMANATAEAAMDEFIKTFPSLGELDREYVWFRPMMKAVSAELLSKVALGVQLRAALGAGLSIADMVSDAVVIMDFYAKGQTGFAVSLMGMIGTNMLLQAGIVNMQTRGLKKDKIRKMLFDFMTILTFTKPGVDAWRVASGAEQAPGAPLNPLIEMFAGKCGEMFAEAIPGLVIQAIAYLQAPEKTFVMTGSLLTSALSTAMTSTTLFYDIDVAPDKRRGNPEWIGLIPDQGRSLAFATLMLLTALHIVAKAFSVALLAVTSSTTLLVYLMVDHGVFFLYKIVRNDWVMFFPMPLAMSVVNGLMFNLSQKAITDFTGCLQFRLPAHLGGSYFLFNLVSSQVGVLGSVYYYTKYDGTDAADRMDAQSLWKFFTALSVAWAATFAFFVARIATSSHRSTLWSTVSGRQWAQSEFLDYDDPSKKIGIFSMNRMMWERDIGADVKAWTLENWATFVEEKPAWFTPLVTATVPDEYIPPQFLAGLGGANRERRGSAALSVRESMRAREGGEDGGEDGG
ncbi:hypothetical protein TeGR_g8255 [Tetraparma gracilis]|uniref:Uncharacterized protein n=1 Tax=Tetraparma gracilis TaxID=2962635 RepID=A0ABQ6N734_9STRA|nr:hypothetical protein TeGR_g8255 [Tetraparma gracilis]